MYYVRKQLNDFSGSTVVRSGLKHSSSVICMLCNFMMNNERQTLDFTCITSSYAFFVLSSRMFKSPLVRAIYQNVHSTSNIYSVCPVYQVQ